MNGAQFVWLVFAVGFAWIVFQRACAESRSRAERAAAFARFRKVALGSRLKPDPAIARRTTIAEASYWP